MKIKLYNIYLCVSLALTTSLSSCWHEDLSDCWKGDVVLSVTAEQFQQAPDAPAVEDMASEIDKVEYYLFDNSTGELKKQGSFSDIQGDHHDLIFQTLPFGTYTLAMTANTEHTESENIDSWKSVCIDCPNTSHSKDYFISLYNFTLDCECGYQDFVKLYRAEGIVDVKLEKLPQNIVKAEIEISHIAETCLPDTTYQGDISVIRTVDVQTQTKDHVTSAEINVFPTPENQVSEVFLKLYMLNGNGEEIIGYSGKINTGSAPFKVLRNQIVEVKADFNYNIYAQPTIHVTINPEWDGVDDDSDIELK